MFKDRATAGRSFIAMIALTVMSVAMLGAFTRKDIARPDIVRASPSFVPHRVIALEQTSHP